MVSSCDYLRSNGGHESNIGPAAPGLELGSPKGRILSARGSQCLGLQWAEMTGLSDTGLMLHARVVQRSEDRRHQKRE